MTIVANSKYFTAECVRKFDFQNVWFGLLYDVSGGPRKAEM